MNISTEFAIANSMSSFVPKYWLNWQILVAIFNEFHRQRWDHKVYIPVHPWIGGQRKHPPRLVCSPEIPVKTILLQLLNDEKHAYQVSPFQSSKDDINSYSVK